MTSLIACLLWVVLAVVWGGGLWALARRRRSVTEQNLHRAEQWREASVRRPPHEDAIMVSLDIALRDGHDAGVTERTNECLPPTEKKR